MHNSKRCRNNAADCLLAAQEACQPYYRKLHLSMAVSWLSLAHHYEEGANLLASVDTPEPAKAEGIVPSPPMPPACPQYHQLGKVG
jgi:hypothetical protein